MIRITCSRCNADLKDPGALIFSPPNQQGTVVKIHLCIDCWKDLTYQFLKWPEVIIETISE